MSTHQVLDITSQLTELERIRRFLRRFCEPLLTAGYDDGGLVQLELAVNEAAANVIKHAFHGREDQSIRIEARTEGDRVIVMILHHGDPFTPDDVPPPSFDGSRSNGFGVYLIKSCVDEVRYTEDDQGQNCIYMVKSFAKP